MERKFFNLKPPPPPSERVSNKIKSILFKSDYISINYQMELRVFDITIREVPTVL